MEELEAKVAWWNESQVYVRCPACEDIHCHGFDGRYDVVHRRASHCKYGIISWNYKMKFPLYEYLGDLGYEIDKRQALFVTAGEDPTAYFAAQEDHSLLRPPTNFDNKRKWTEAVETIHYSLEEYGISGGYTSNRFSEIIADLVMGKVEQVRRYLNTSTEADILLYGIQATKIKRYHNNGSEPDDETSPDEEELCITGNTALHLAARENYPRMVELLLQKEVDPNAADIDGRVPLVEAALWGRVENVKLLLKYGADKELECVRRGRLLKAIDFARPSRENTEERYQRSGDKDQVYKENTRDRDLDRRAIVLLLGGGQEEQRLDRLRLAGFAFARSPTNENLVTFISHFEVPGKWKTIAVMDRGSQFQLVAAMSGWAHGTDTNVRVAGKDWTPEVLRLSSKVEHALEPHSHDGGVPGQFYACHAEKQLVLFFINKHLFQQHELPEGDMASPMRSLSLEDISAEEFAEHRQKLLRLQEVEPPVRHQNVRILVSRQVCDDCRSFIDLVNSYFNLDIQIFHRCMEKDCRECTRYH